ncbi:hypothetical protein A2841_03745 [Candidatus Kaiserbacteria bacterium RIFCSPHIGHO2_01_FULL_48_10]|uniref:histidine kinase n=1 Tax=Candidatus Kaiserbacteria bacterium RIFCSPHIGHO2_01_FULL_48_10 TaxID=1798476 RepID=A0A1F6C1B7_9BACT|nr:MAG: hypothetical protein A2841_03745 [Candidatus Kaiserbacteria bacterium RIFCSPHIGHO2_01_FULL_48_10]
MRFESCYPEDNHVSRIREIFERQGSTGLVENGDRTTSFDHIFFQIAVQMTDHVVFTNKNGVVLYANNAAEDITGYTLHEMFGQTPRLWGGLMPSEYYEEIIWDSMQKGIPLERVLLNRRKDGHTYVALSSLSSISEDGVIVGYVATEKDITALRDIDREKSEFVSLASHQLRTPLTTVSWYIEMIIRGDVGSVIPEQKKYLEEIYHGNQRMVELVNTLLDVSRLELGTLTVELKPTNVVALAKSVLDEQKPNIEKKRLIVIENTSKDVPAFLADPRLLRMVFQNFLANAVEYTPPGGRIELTVSYDAKMVSIKVSDTGYGIPKNQQDKIFTKLFRADNVRAKDTDGTGLGLYIVKSIVENSGGKIWFESEENKGTTFYVSLPLNSATKKKGVRALR